MITPPIGMNCFVLRGAAPELELGEIFKGAANFYHSYIVIDRDIILFPTLHCIYPNNSIKEREVITMSNWQSIYEEKVIDCTGSGTNDESSQNFFLSHM